MNEQDKNLEQNISRLVKSVNSSQQPSKQFTQDLIGKAIAELPQQTATGRQKRSLLMKPVSFFIKIAAVVLIIGFIGTLFIKSKNFFASSDYSKTISQQVTYNWSGNRNYFTDKGIALYSMDGTVVGDACLIANYPPANGGTTPPNGEPYDAMFFKNYGVNPFIDTEDDHLSTFATDVDTGSYTLCRQYLRDGNLPPRDAVRVEEFVNAFKYHYPAPAESLFAVYAEAMPWNFDVSRRNTFLMRIALKGKEILEENRKPAILTFVIDVSGSMEREDRLELVKKSLNILVDHLRPNDKIGIAVYGSNGHQVLAHQDLRHKSAILEAIASLRPEGSTNAEEGIRIGYEMAEEAFVPGYINRVILCSDGVANVGNTGPDEIFKVIKDKADKGITLSALGFGMGNYNDVLMERLGDKGNGYYAYIDTLEQAQKLFGENLTGALQVIARDVKIQVDFNPQAVRSYRLIGYENRDVADKDFRNDIVDGGEIGAGHAATALYELKLQPNAAGTLATVYVRYKDADTFEVTEFKSPFQTSEIAAGSDQTSKAFTLAATVTEFAEILRESYWARQADLETTLQKARQLAAGDPGNAQIAELVDLITRAQKLLQNKTAQTETPPQPQTTDDLQPLPMEQN